MESQENINLVIGAYIKRNDPRDAFISSKTNTNDHQTIKPRRVARQINPHKPAMKSALTLPIVSGIALAVMAGAAASHYSSVNNLIAFAGMTRANGMPSTSPGPARLVSNGQDARSIVAELQRRFSVSAAETGWLDLHRRAGIGVAVVAADRAHVVEVLDAAERIVAGRPEIELLSVRRDLRRSDD